MSGGILGIKVQKEVLVEKRTYTKKYLNQYYSIKDSILLLSQDECLKSFFN